MTTYENIKRISKKRGYSLPETAKKAGLSINALYRYNQGIEPKYETLEKIADALNVQLSDLSDRYKPSNKKKIANLDDENTLMMYGGKPIPKDEMDTVRKILRGLRNSDDSKK
ncbi:helix-turn-helix domain-containing protein [Fructilactobacillus fructivorans]|nr:helix-turn-helix transcriptional regulator [Fructilactobacillus fructivorans]KRK58478.1 hypothetical protein FC73_GL000028 [Fructilactobacillus fructivorans]KRN13319.1 hypothetical protein IV37_GL000030 [Fructilactobacillus fructivorans]KRN40028.1 hypothetical protein IV51_GL000205 [Fructilactobacillus fructivorans]KRN42322.1 hypothetical protein IV48_GL000409 [Fructilactobacillus fructivorans]